MTAPVVVGIEELPNIYSISASGAAATYELTQRAVCLMGWSVGNGAASAQTAKFYNGPSPADQLVGLAFLAANGGDSQSMPWPGVLCDSGLSVVTDGTDTTVVVWVFDIPQ